jgi:hypothetical protein
VALGNKRQFRIAAELATQVGARNRLRAQFDLPPVNLEDELLTAKGVQDGHLFAMWMSHPIRERVEVKLLQRLRRRINNPSWTPTGILSGGGMAFQVRLTQQMQRLRSRQGDDWLERNDVPDELPKTTYSFELG